jgi:hypothetical protein
VIGHIPRWIILDSEITEMMCALLAPVRPFGYVFAYSGGAHKAIRGHYSFFDVDLTHTGAVMNHYLETGANPLVYCVLCGRMTPKQKELARQRAELDTAKMMKLMRWFIEDSGHPGYADVVLPEHCPKPVVIEDPETEHNTNVEQDPELEKSFEGATFHFSSSQEPHEDTGVHETSQKFVKAMIEKTMPTLLVSGGTYTDPRELSLENVAVVQFPFGQGGPKMRRRNKVSPISD